MKYKKYYYSFKDIEEQLYRVEIWEEEGTPQTVHLTTALGSDSVIPFEDINLFTAGDVLSDCAAFSGDVTVVYVNSSGGTLIVSEQATSSGAVTAVVTFVTPAAVEIEPDASPCVIKTNNDHLYNPVVGSGADLQITSVTGMQFFNLYSENMMQFTVIIYKVTLGVDSLYWVGFLDSEHYSEPFAEYDNYPVNLTANDGFNLLNRISYADYNATLNTITRHTGFVSEWVMLLTVLQKLNLPWSKIYVGLSTTIPDVVIGATETIFHKVYANNENWYDEDGVALTCREVLESILKTYGAFIIQQDGDLYITDSNYIASNTQSFKVYTYAFEATAYDSTVNVDHNLGDITALGTESAEQTFEVESGINRQVVRFSPYESSDIMDYDAESDIFSGDLGTVTGYPTWSGEWNYIEQSLANSLYWDDTNNGRFVILTGTGTKNLGKTSQKLKLVPYATWLTDYSARLAFAWKATLPTLNEAGLKFIKLDMSMFLMTYAKWGADINDPIVPIVEAKIHMDIFHSITVDGVLYKKKYIYKLDDGHYTVATQGWTTDLATESFFQFRRESIIDILNERDIELQKFDIVGELDLLGGVTIEVTKARPFLIPIVGIGAGRLEVRIYDALFRDSGGTWHTGYQPLPDSGPIFRPTCYINNLSMSIVDKNGEDISKLDLEYTSEINSNFANEGEEVDCYLGTNTSNYPLQRGSLMLKGLTNFFPYVDEFTKAGVTAQPEHLLLRSIKSNYGGANAKLSVDLSIVRNFGYLTYNNFLPGKKMAVLENTRDLKEAISSVVLREIHIDDATIL